MKNRLKEFAEIYERGMDNERYKLLSDFCDFCDLYYSTKVLQVKTKILVEFATKAKQLRDMGYSWRGVGDSIGMSHQGIKSIYEKFYKRETK